MPRSDFSMPVDEIHIWYAEPLVNLDENLLSEYFVILDSEERGRYGRLLAKSKRREFLVAHTLLRHSLSNYAPIEPKDWRFRRALSGRPEVSAPTGFSHPQFSLSHTDGLVAVCIAFGRTIGLDVELIQTRNDSLRDISAYFAKSEIEALNNSNKESHSQDFYLYWTLKEAFLKAQGTGLAYGLANIAFQIDRENRVNINFLKPSGENPLDWRFYLPRLTKSHQAALAIRWGKPDLPPSEPKLRFWKVNPDLTADEVNVSV